VRPGEIVRLNPDQLSNAVWWEQQRAQQISQLQSQGLSGLMAQALGQQQADLQRLSQLTNAYYGNCASTAMSASTCGGFGSAITGGPSYMPQLPPQPTFKQFHEIPDEPKTPAERRRASREARERARKSAEEAKAAAAAKALAEANKPRYELPKGGLTWENSPLFGRPSFGMFYNWTFHSPFKSLGKWLLRWAWGVQRGIA
jgi:hypothetical protein